MAVPQGIGQCFLGYAKKIIGVNNFRFPRERRRLNVDAGENAVTSLRCQGLKCGNVIGYLLERLEPARNFSGLLDGIVDQPHEATHLRIKLA